MLAALRRGQDVRQRQRPDRSAGRDRALGARGRIPGHRRPFRLRQVDAAADRGRPGAADARQRAIPWRGSDRAAAGHRLLVPAVRQIADAVAHRDRQRRLRGGAPAGDDTRRRARTQPGLFADGGAGGLRRALSRAALRWHAAARDHRPRARRAAPRPADGRTLQLGGRAHAAGTARHRARPLAEAWLHRGARHARRGRGRVPGRSHRGAVGTSVARRPRAGNRVAAAA